MKTATKKKKYFYKVVVRSGKGDYKSLYARALKPRYQLRYKQGRVTRALPTTPGVFVFDSLLEAQSITRAWSTDRVVLRVEARGEPVRVTFEQHVRRYTDLHLNTSSHSFVVPAVKVINVVPK
jgi:hypothetical protein